jgi:Caulimovirus viroplasmin
MLTFSVQIKTPQQVVDDLVSISDKGTFYIVMKGREPGIYTDW